jgi:saccharopine dehydrogenase-like NADP-dependent oxidoreductase
MKVLLIGVGMQGKAVLHDLALSEQVTAITAADYDFEALQTYVAASQFGGKVRCEPVDAADEDGVDRLLVQHPDVMINLLPKSFINPMASAALKHGVHLVFTSYTTPELREMDAEAKAKNVTILPEFGLDPGIDLVLLGHAVRQLDTVEDIFCYGAGFPEPEAAGNPIKYKVSWTFEGVLKSYRRQGRIIRDGEIVEISDAEMFNPEHVLRVELPGLGELEAFPNGDALPYARALGLDIESLKNLGRFAMRWPGHSAFWKSMVDLHLLDSEPVMVDGVAVDRHRFLAAAMAPHLQYAANERDIVVVRVEVKGWRNGEKKQLTYQMIDKRDLKTGFMAMNRTVGFTASIGAMMVGRGQITKRGVLSPINDVPYEPFVRELARRDIQVTSEGTDDD